MFKEKAPVRPSHCSSCGKAIVWQRVANIKFFVHAHSNKESCNV